MDKLTNVLLATTRMPGHMYFFATCTLLKKKKVIIPHHHGIFFEVKFHPIHFLPRF